MPPPVLHRRLAHRAVCGRWPRHNGVGICGAVNKCAQRRAIAWRVNNARIHLSTSEVLTISREVDRLSAELDELNPENPSDAARINFIMAELYRFDAAVTNSLATPSRAH